MCNNNKDRFNSNDIEERNGYNNNNRGNYKKINDISRSDKLIKNNNDKFVKEKPEMFAELDLDKNNHPSHIKIRITNPYYQLFKNNKNNSALKDYRTNSLKKVHKSKSTKDMIDNNYYSKKDRNIKKDYNTNRIDNRKKLGPLKIKRKIDSNYNTLNKYSIKNDFNDKNDNKININDYKYFHNKEICNALSHKSRKKCESCLCILNQKREEEKKNLIPKRKLNIKNIPNSRNNKDIQLVEDDHGKINYYNKKNIWEKNNAYSSSHNKLRKTKKKKINKRKNYSNNDSKSSSTNYANVINIEFPLLKSYFH
jgi:hypothetical protein